ncbi:MAG: CDP-diacylglycerol--glycerol-3-phosphate 3-phosphatidyltransferase [Holosporales bacterium]|jgi:cardiolipin synthase|nr:CDP-diacylglycerol--glycerol-3-phosphate 3-phosphatidyltransferase [Holosporales bacterium]
MMNRISTVPNILTISRVLLLPVFALGFFMETKNGMILALAVFVLCCITDYLDGYYARAYKQTTKFGRILDPLADKILVAIAILFLIGFNIMSRLSIIPAAVILCREVIISGIRDATEAAGDCFKTTILAKWKTAMQMLAISIVIFANVIESETVSVVGEAMLWGSAVIAVCSGLIYCRRRVF